MYVDKSGLKPGDRFGRLEAVELAPSDTGNNRCWLFRCDCGREKVVRVVRVKAAHTVSCGCARKGRVLPKKYASPDEALRAHLPECPTTGCWDWKGAVGTHGYGVLTYRRVHMLAHRVSYETFVGPIPDEKHVLHSCDNRRCCNPDHFFIGDDQVNVADKVSKRRHHFGERTPSAKLTKAQVREIVDCQEVPAHVLAERFGVAASGIYKIRQGKSWVLGRQ